MGRTEQEFRKYRADIEEGYTRQIRAGRGPTAKVQRVQDEVVWDATCRQSRSQYLIGDIHCRIRAYALQPPDHAPYVVLIMLSSQDPSELDDVIDSFAPPAG